MQNIEKNNSIFLEMLGHSIIGVERFDGRLLVMLGAGESVKMIEIDRKAKIKKVK